MTEKKYNVIPHIRVTTQSLENFQTQGLPDTILEKLTVLENQKEKQETEFTELLKKHLGDGDFAAYSEQILKHVEISARTVYVNGLTYKKSVDYDKVVIVDADYDEIDSLCCMIESDKDPFRKYHYKRMNCIIKPEILSKFPDIEPRLKGIFHKVKAED